MTTTIEFITALFCQVDEQLPGFSANIRTRTRPSKRAAKPCWSGLCKGMQRVEADTDHPSASPPVTPGTVYTSWSKPHQPIAPLSASG